MWKRLQHNEIFLSIFRHSKGLQTIGVLAPIPRDAMKWTPGFPTRVKYLSLTYISQEWWWWWYLKNLSIFQLAESIFCSFMKVTYGLGLIILIVSPLCSNLCYYSFLTMLKWGFASLLQKWGSDHIALVSEFALTGSAADQVSEVQ